MIQLKIYRGADQIGGCTEITAGGERILIDFGANLPNAGNDGAIKDAEMAAKVFDGRPASAVLFTHGHGDHYGLYKEIPPGTPMYIGPLYETAFFAPAGSERARYYQVVALKGKTQVVLHAIRAEVTAWVACQGEEADRFALQEVGRDYRELELLGHCARYEKEFDDGPGRCTACWAFSRLSGAI